MEQEITAEAIAARYIGDRSVPRGAMASACEKIGLPYDGNLTRSRATPVQLRAIWYELWPSDKPKEEAKAKFRIGGVYRQQNGMVVRLETVPWGEHSVPRNRRDGWCYAHIVVHLDGKNRDGGDGARLLSNGRYVHKQDIAEHGAHLIPGELHQVDGQWVPIDSRPEPSRTPTLDKLEAEHSANAAMLARDSKPPKDLLSPAIAKPAPRIAHWSERSPDLSPASHQVSPAWVLASARNLRED